VAEPDGAQRLAWCCCDLWERNEGAAATEAHGGMDSDSPAWTEAMQEWLGPASVGRFIVRVKSDAVTSGNQVVGRCRHVGPVSASAPLTGGPHYNCFPTKK
jgi:hypothetical protein